jgi:cell wall-associated NlpC family hydrolase
LSPAASSLAVKVIELVTVLRTSYALRLVAATALLAGLVCVAGSTAYAGPSISAAQAEAQRISAQLQQLDASAHVANSQYERATAKLALVQKKLSQNTRALGVARVNLSAAQKALSRRLVEIYMSQNDHSSLTVLLGSTSLDNLVSRMDTLNAVTKQDSALIREVSSYERSIVRHRQLLHRARRSVGRLVLERAAAKRTIQAKLAAEQRLYDSVQSQIAQLEEQQRANQLAAERRAQSAIVVPELGGGPVLNGNLPGDRYSAAVGIAEQYIGVPYVWGGASPSGFDCSGLVMYVYGQLGVSLPHYTVSQYGYPNAVHPDRSQLEPGDLVFFAGLGHVGIYIGNNEFIHAPHTGATVTIDSMTGWYSDEYYGATRILG